MDYKITERLPELPPLTLELNEQPESAASLPAALQYTAVMPIPPKKDEVVLETIEYDWRYWVTVWLPSAMSLVFSVLGVLAVGVAGYKIVTLVLPAIISGAAVAIKSALVAVGEGLAIALYWVAVLAAVVVGAFLLIGILKQIVISAATTEADEYYRESRPQQKQPGNKTEVQINISGDGVTVNNSKNGNA